MGKAIFVRALIFSAVALAARAAFAHDPTPPADTSPEETTAPAETAVPGPAKTELPVERHRTVGYGFTVGGGVTNFTDSDMRDMTGSGGNWTARLLIGTRRTFALEAAYIGAAHPLDVFGVSDNALLMAHGAESDLRLNLSTGQFQPYLFGGVAWKRYSVSNTQVNFSNVRESDHVVEIPVGGGFAARGSRGFLFDMRFDYRPTFDEELVGSRKQPGIFVENLENWNVTARLGWEF